MFRENKFFKVQEKLANINISLEETFRCDLNGIIIHLKYFPVSDWLKSHV